MDLRDLDLNRFVTAQERTEFLQQHWEYACEKVPTGEEQPTFVEWLEKQGIKGRYEQETELEPYEVDTLPIDDLETVTRFTVRDPFPRTFGINGEESETDRNQLEGWTFWSKQIGVDRSFLLFADTMLLVMGLILARTQVIVRTEWLTTTVESLRMRWNPKWKLSDMPTATEEDRKNATWCVDNKSRVVNGGGFKSVDLMKDWVEGRARRSTYRNLKKLAGLVTTFVHETSPLLERSGTIVVSMIERIVRTNYHCDISGNANMDELLGARNFEPRIWLDRMFRRTSEGPDARGIIRPNNHRDHYETPFVEDTLTTLRTFIQQDLRRQGEHELRMRAENAPDLGDDADRNNNNETLLSQYESRVISLTEMLARWRADPDNWPQFNWLAEQ